MARKIKFKKSSGNVFADVGFVDANLRLAKSRLAFKINRIIEDRNLKQAEAAKILGVNQPKISAISNGVLDAFSIERLIQFLNKLDQDVEVVIRGKPGRARRSSHFKVSFE